MVWSCVTTRQHIHCAVVSAELTHRVVDPAFPTAVVVLVMALEHQATLSIELLCRPVEFAVNIRPMEDSAIFICVHPLTLQSIVYIETLQGTVEGRDRKRSAAMKPLLNSIKSVKREVHKTFSSVRMT